MKRVLIVDEKSSMRTLVRDILEHWPEPWYVEEEENGLDGVVNLECRDYDLLICDVNMPGMDGFQVVQKIRGWEWNPNIPVIMLTAESDPSCIARAALAGVTSYLLTPINREELVEAIHDVLG